MNQRVVIVGRPGTGKTTLAIDLAANWEGDWVWVDTIREFAKWDKKKLLERFEQDKIKKIWKLEQLESRLTNFFMDQARKIILRTPRRIIFFPLAGTDKLLQRQLSFLLSLLKKRSKKFKNDMLLILDESHHYASGNEASEPVKILLQEGRHDNISQIYISQSPKSVTQDVLRGATHYAVFQLTHPNDLKFFSNFVSQETVERIPSLQVGDFLLYDVNKGSFTQEKII